VPGVSIAKPEGGQTLVDVLKHYPTLARKVDSWELLDLYTSEHSTHCLNVGRDD
jgi:hypothetical protein